MARGIRIISDTEKFFLGDMDTDGYRFHYRRIPNHIRGDIINKHTVMDKRGRSATDAAAASREMLEYALLGWDDGSVIDINDQNVPFSIDAVKWLPDDIGADILEAAGANMPNSRAREVETENL